MELRLALRGIRRDPVVPGSVALAIGVSVAVCTSLFSVLDGLLFRPLPMLDSERLAVLEYRPVNGRPPLRAHLPELAPEREILRSRITNSPLVSGYADAHLAVFFDAYESARQGLQVQAVDARFLPLLGLTPILGVGLSGEDERLSSGLASPSAEPLPIVIGHTLWREVFGSSPVLTVHELAGRQVRIVGVLPVGVKYPGDTNVWVAAPPRADRPPSHVKLAIGVTVAQVQALVPELRVRTAREVAYPQESTGVVLLFGSALLLLAMTWVQVTGVVWLWASGQAGSTAIRVALGANRWHFWRQSAIQGGLIAVAAFGTAALAVQPLTDLIIANLPPELSGGQYLRPDYRAFLFLCAVSVVGFALLSQAALRASVRVSPIDALRVHTGSGLGPQRTVRRTLLIAQLTLTSSLLYLTGLAAHSFANAITMDYGFDVSRVMIVNPPRRIDRQLPPKDQMAANLAFKRVLNASIERVAAIPGVVGVATAFSGPLGIANQRPAGHIESIDGRPPFRDMETIDNAVSTDFVRALGATLLEGRSFADPEFRTRADVAVVNETLARQLYEPMTLAGRELQMPVIGRRITTVDGTAEIIGIVKDFVGSRIGVASPPQVFRHDLQSLASAVMFVRTDRVLAADHVEAVRKALESTLGPLPDRHFGKLVDELQPLLTPYRSQATLLSFIAVCCLPIAAMGLTAAMSNSVRTRRSELAVHLAIGATPKDIRGLVMREALTATGVGVLWGSLLGAAIGSVVSSQLFGVFPLDALTVVAVAVVLAGLCSLAAWIPVRAASRLDPALILRGDSRA